jgi:replicative DNA helicase
VSASGGKQVDVRTFDELLVEYANERGVEEYAPVRLGFGSLDADMRGISAGQVCGIAARTAVGKTWALETVAHNFAARRDVGQLHLSLEMPGLEWAERALAIFADVAPEQVETWAKTGQLANNAGKFLEHMRHALVVEQAVRLAELPAVIEQARAKLAVPLRLVVLDYMGLLTGDGRDAYERASAVGLGLKRIAKAQRVAVIVATQVSRAGGDGAQPVTLAMLRDSGVIEESLDFLLGAWRPGKADGLNPVERDDLRDVMRVALLKNRKGRDGRTVDLRFRPASRRLVEDASPFSEAVS